MNGDYVEKQRKYAADMWKMYHRFDAETGGRFHEACEHAGRRVEFLTAVNTRNFDVIYRPENADFLQELSRHDRFFIDFEHRFPKLYHGLRRLKSGAPKQIEEKESV